jgi:hypothetical protein
LFAVALWSLLILRFGYRYGTGDQVELLPYTLYLHNPNLYPHDFFIQGLNASIPNERTVLANLLLPFVNHLEIFCFVFQFFSTVFLILGLEKLARRFIRNKYLAWFSIAVAIIPLNDFTLGNVELYSECFQASGLAVAIVVWAVNFFLERKFFTAALLMSTATFIQLLEGLDVALVLTAILLLAVIKKETELKTFLKFIGVYLFTAGIYLFAILMKKSAAAEISNEELFKILFEFRHPHHFIFSAFSELKTIVFFALAGFSILIFLLRSKTIFQFVLIGLAGVLVYAFAVDNLHQIFIGNFQFYKVTIWIKFLGVVALFGFAEELFSSVFLLLSSMAEKIFLATSVVLTWSVIIFFHQQLPYKVPFQLFGMKKEDEIISICRQIQQKTASDAVFIQPFENTELKFYAQRSSYIEFKANVRNKIFVSEWYKRIQKVFGVSYSALEKGFLLQEKADKYFYSLSPAALRDLKDEGVTHILTKKEFPPSAGTLILSNNSYAVYQL